MKQSAMKKFSQLERMRIVAAAFAGALTALAAVQAQAQTTDISQTPLASASNLSVLPNLMFLLDDSGSMMWDFIPDNTERVLPSSERRYFSNNHTCKPKGILTTSGTAALNGLPANHCDRGDPPLFSVQHNGMYYNPQYTYRPPLNFDGTGYPKQTNWSSVDCDPYGSGWGCDKWYNTNQGYYDNGSGTANEGAGNQSYSNPNVAKWYDSSSNFDILSRFPEVVYCNSSGASVTDINVCRRNGIITTTNPFRYSTARWGRNAATSPISGGYPDSPAVHEFWRSKVPTTNTVVVVTTAHAHSIPTGNACKNDKGAAAACQIIPRTGTGTTGSGLDSTTPVTITPTGPHTFTYSMSGRTGQKLAYGSYDNIVGLSRGANVVTVSAAWNHGLTVGDKINVTETVCGSSSCGFTLSNVSIMAVVDAHTFRYNQTASNKTAVGYYRRAELFNIPKLSRGNPYYYTIEPVEHCKDAALTDCKASTVPDTAYPYPATLRYCSSHFDANRLDSFPADATKSASSPHWQRLDSTKPRCRKKYEEATGYKYPRYGQFRRVDIVPATATYGNRPLRTDCAARPVCTYAEEMTNFGNWFTYYRTRMLTMKTAAGIAFSPIDDRYRVGFLTINPMSGGSVDSNKYLKIEKFTPSHKKLWYEMFYKQDPGGGTPLPEALSRVGRHYAGVKSGINDEMDDDPVQYSCQQNFTLVTTDGMWSGRDGITETGAGIGNLDNTGPRPQYDGGNPFNPDTSDNGYSSSGTLADVALHYYQTDLRKSGATGALGTDVSENNVPTGQKDKANWQHMVTFGLGMVDGLMDWRADYDSPGITGDFDNVSRGAPAGNCSWTPGQCNWPMPGDRVPANIDDLWHAAVNGRGKYFFARDSQSVQEGLNTALTSLQERSASGAAAATSTPNITPSDRGIFKTSYTTVQWNGEIIAQLIDPNDGSVLPGILWSAKEKLQGRVGLSTDSRTIYLGDYDETSGHKLFTYANLDATEQVWFDKKCDPVSTMSQCALLDPTTQLPVANDGTNLMNFLRGQTQHEVSIYRDRQFALGDTINAVPLYVAQPRLAFADKVSPTYGDWAATSAVKNRTPALYVAANDGMLHAFNANTGDELWAFIPRQIAPNMWKLAEKNYASKHQYYVDGSPTSMDIWDGGGWRTILVGGLNAGGRGFYALDITNPNAPQALWEFCHDAALCPIYDQDVGYSFGNPIITKRESDGEWVVLVTSGLNNVSPGDGQGYLYVLDALTGKIQKKIGTGVGSTTKPSGLNRISAWADSFFTDNSSKWVYGGDQEGYVWRFTLTDDDDTNDPLYSVLPLARALDGSGRPQPITTRPELGLVDEVHKVVYVGTGRYVGVQDLTDPATQSPAGTWAWQQSVYAFKDQGLKKGNLRSAANQLVNQTITELSGGQERTVSNNTVDWGTQGGWYVDLNPGNKSPGERINVDPQLALGTLLVVTNVPGATACAIGGDSWLYQFDYRDGSYVQGAPSNLVARKLTGALTVGLSIYQLPNNAIVGQGQGSNTEMHKRDINTAPGSTPSRRSSWREITPDQ
jgi:type IV pilus assembly protein PilY1